MPQLDFDIIWPEPKYPPCLPIPPEYRVENLDEDTRLDLIHFIERNCGAVFMELGGYNLIVNDDLSIESNEQTNFENLSDPIWECNPRSYYEPESDRQIDIYRGHLQEPRKEFGDVKPERFFHEEEMILHILRDHFKDI